MKKTVSRNLITGLVVVAVVALLMVWGMQGVANVECEVCIEFKGQERCRTAQGSSRDEALRTAINNACAELTGSMAETIQCERSEPVSVECR